MYINSTKSTEAMCPVSKIIELDSNPSGYMGAEGPDS